MHNANLQGVMDPWGFPLFISDGKLRPVHGLAAARIHVLPTLYAVAAQGLVTLADLGYEGAGIGILTPVKRPEDDRPRLRTPGRSIGASVTLTSLPAASPIPVPAARDASRGPMTAPGINRDAHTALLTAKALARGRGRRSPPVPPRRCSLSSVALAVAAAEMRVVSIAAFPLLADSTADASPAARTDFDRQGLPRLDVCQGADGVSAGRSTPASTAPEAQGERGDALGGR
ncbi:hypothetical protein NOGI109294_18270 [Nocardiopsis gilva]